MPPPDQPPTGQPHWAFQETGRRTRLEACAIRRKRSPREVSRELSGPDSFLWQSGFPC
jgi:hypothetical protein